MANNLHKLKIYKPYSDSIARLLSIKHSSKAISEIITSLLLLAVTVVGGILVFVMINGSDFIGDVSSSTTSAQKASGSLKLTGFDTRDGTNLYNITAIDNNILTSGLVSGEHVILKIRNDSPNIIFLESLQINDVTHTSDTSGSVVTATSLTSGTYGIVNGTCTTCTLASSVEIGDGKEVRLIVRLSGSVGTIALNKTVRSTISYGGLDPTTFIIPAGSIR